MFFKYTLRIYFKTKGHMFKIKIKNFIYYTGLKWHFFLQVGVLIIIIIEN